MPSAPVPSPHRWIGPVVTALIIAGALLAYLLYEVWSLATASKGALQVTGVEYLLLGGGAILCWGIAGVLLRWRRSTGG